MAFASSFPVIQAHFLFFAGLITIAFNPPNCVFWRLALALYPLFNNYGIYAAPSSSYVVFFTDRIGPHTFSPFLAHRMTCDAPGVREGFILFRPAFRSIFLQAPWAFRYGKPPRDPSDTCVTGILGHGRGPFAGRFHAEAVVRPSSSQAASAVNRVC